MSSRNRGDELRRANESSHAKPSDFRGAWILPNDSAYEDVRGVFNTRVDAHPAVVAQCASTNDVATVVRFARSHDLALAVRCTGFSLGGFSGGTGMVVIDLSLMRAVEIDVERRVARVEGGMRGGDLQTEAARFGLAGPSGTLPGTGIGLHLGGGIGHISARIGYGSDNVLAFELVTADADVVRASPNEHADLFWAVRGSTGNFGVVTALELQLYDIPSTVLAGRVTWSLDQAVGVFQGLRECWKWPDDFNVVPLFSSAACDGRGGLEIWSCHCGPEDQARADFELLRRIGEPAHEDVRTISFRDYHFLYQDEYPPMRVGMDDQPVDSVSDELVAALVELMRQDRGTGMRAMEVVPRRGALQRDPRLPSALRDTGEDPTWNIHPAAYWYDTDEDEAHDRWIAQVIAVVKSIGPTNERKHPNGVAVPLEPDGVAAMYGDRFDRLRAIKRQWDPDNVFRGSHNIPPAET